LVIGDRGVVIFLLDIVRHLSRNYNLGEAIAHAHNGKSSNIVLLANALLAGVTNGIKTQKLVLAKSGVALVDIAVLNGQMSNRLN
jgi:hypothetical protein